MIFKFFKKFLDDIQYIFHTKTAKILFVLFNLAIIYMNLLDIVVVTEEGFIQRTCYNIRGTEYEWSDIEQVKVGYYTKGRFQGDFYYEVKMLDHKTININYCMQNEDNDVIKDFDEQYLSDDYDFINTYAWIEMIDQRIMQEDVIKIADFDSESKRYPYDTIYADLFMRIMENQ